MDNKEKKIYTEAEIEIIHFGTDDVVCISGWDDYETDIDVEKP